MAELHVKFYVLCDDLNKEFSNLDSVIGEHSNVSEQKLDLAHKYWTNILQLYIQLKNTGEKYLHQSSKVSLLKFDITKYDFFKNSIYDSNIVLYSYYKNKLNS